jgi:hypothetical protein
MYFSLRFNLNKILKVILPNVNVVKCTVVAKKTGNENLPNVNLVLFLCQLIIIYLTIPIK